MTRKNNLQESVNRYLIDKQGSYKKRQYYRFVLNKIIEDCFEIRAVPAHWHDFKISHVKQLVAHWQNQEKKASSIMNYLSCLRHFLASIGNVLDIENKSLGLGKSRNSLKPTVHRESIFLSLTHPYSQILFGLQSFFGLTKAEAIKFNPEIHCKNESLWITREISHNRLDRSIPIESQIQIKILKLVKNFDHYLLAQPMKAFYTMELKKLGLPTQINYRYLYAQARKKELSHLLRSEFLSIIKNEMAIASDSTMWEYCHE